MTGLTFLCPLRHVRPNRSNANAAEMIRDVGDNVPPGDDWAAPLSAVKFDHFAATVAWNTPVRILPWDLV
jgi:hypothetical protein